jgi:hypothetical protein
MTTYTQHAKLEQYMYPETSGYSSAGFRHSRHYINASTHDVTIVLRNGLPVQYPKTNDSYNKRRVIVRDQYDFRSRDHVVASIRLLNQHIEVHTPSPELALILQALMAHQNHATLQECSIVVDQYLDIQTLIQQRHVYLQESDVLIQYGPYDPNVSHPHSMRGQSDSAYLNYTNQRRCTGIVVEIVDNEKTIGSRYLYVAKQLVEIPTLADPSRPSGVYYTHLRHDDVSGSQIEPLYCGFEDAEHTLGLYSTQEDAMTGGSPELIHRHQSTESERELLQTRQELERLRTESKIREIERTETMQVLRHEQDTAKHRHEVELAELKEHLVKLEHSVAKTKRRNDQHKEHYETRKYRRDDYYDERSAVRKDSSELAKYAPGIVIGVIGALAYWGKK